MFEQIGLDRTSVEFAGAAAGTGPLTWGQQAIRQDMRDNRDQFTMWGVTDLPAGSTVAAAADLVRGLVVRHDALRSRLCDGGQSQRVAGSGSLDLDIWTLPAGADAVDLARCIEHLVATWPLVPFDFHDDWPLRTAVIRQRGACTHLVWALSHLAADGMANMMALRDLRRAMAGELAGDPQGPQLLDLAAREQEPSARGLSARAMTYWESQLANIPALTFGEPAGSGDRDRDGHRYWRIGFRSPAADLAIGAIARRTGTDVSRVTLAVVMAAVARATGVAPLTANVMVSNRFRPGLADVFAPVAQNSVVTIDPAGVPVDQVVARARAATATSGMRACYDPGDLARLTARLDAERGYPARVSFRFNDQRALVRRAGEAAPGGGSADEIGRKLAQTALTWEAPLDHLHDQVSIVVLNRLDVLSVILRCDLRSLPAAQAEALLRGIEEVAVEAAADPSAPSAPAVASSRS